MNAKKLSEYHRFTRGELHQILVDAKESLPKSYWLKASSNPIFDMGHYFNRCVEWVGLNEYNSESFPAQIVTIRVLEKFSKFSKVQLPKNPAKPDVQYREEPKI